MRVMISAVMVLLGLSGGAQALEYCDELWFLRNSVFHEAGYCFGSPLGQAVFGNESCTGKDVTISAKDKQLIADVRAAESDEACAIDTSRQRINMSRLDLRRQLTQLPFPDIFESACLGWQRAPLALMPAPSLAGAPIGWAENGQDLLFQYLDHDGWSFVEVTENGDTVALGWAQFDWTEDMCAAVAG